MAQRPQPSFRARPRGGRNIAALVAHLETQPGWDSAVRFNAFTQGVEVRAPWPPIVGAPVDDWVPMEDVAHVLRATRYFQDNGYDKVTKSIADDALRLFADDMPYHPVEQYLDPLVWDGTRRNHMLAEHYLGAVIPAAGNVGEFRDYLAMLSRYWMISAVARIKEPGCKMDYVPVLVGEVQGEGKSEAFKALVPDPGWFTDDVGYNPRNKDAKDSLRGKWIAELAEMHILRSDPEALKSFITTATDRYRPPYGRASRDFPRQSVFIGTCNDLELPDVTGNRRYWPFRVGRINLAAIRADRDQLWAEAVADYKAGAQRWPTDAEMPVFRRQQDEFAAYDTWQDEIFQWVNGGKTFTLVSMFEQLRPALLNGYKETRADQMRAADCLKRLGCWKTGVRNKDRSHQWQSPPAVP